MSFIFIYIYNVVYYWRLEHIMVPRIIVYSMLFRNSFGYKFLILNLMVSVSSGLVSSTCLLYLYCRGVVPIYPRCLLMTCIRYSIWCYTCGGPLWWPRGAAAGVAEATQVGRARPMNG